MVALPVMAVAAWCICTGLIGKGEVENFRLEDDCVRFIRKSLPKILNDWSVSEWKVRATNELKLSVKMKDVEKRFKENRRTFGAIRQIRSTNGHVDVDNSGGVPETVGYYTSTVRFEGGTADVAMRIVKRAGGWKFQQFSVRSDMATRDD